MSKLQIKGKYPGDTELTGEAYEKYVTEQIKIHGRKANRQRPFKEYEICAENMINNIKDGGKMICLGTRNEYEKNSFTSLLSDKNIRVYSQDISEAAGPDYVGDFNKLAQIVPPDWDVIYSNCLDHAIDANATVNEWLKVMNDSAILVMGFCFQPSTIAGDVCIFSPESVNEFIDTHPNLKYVNDFKAGAWHYWTTKKI